MKSKIESAAIVLAAGMSQRMGRLKMLLPFGDRPMLARSVESLLALQEISPILVVTGHAAQEIEDAVREYSGIRIVPNAEYAAGGMLSSVQAGVRALPGHCNAFFLALGDQPMVSPQTLSALLSARRKTGATIVMPTYQGRRGHPVLFDRQCGQEILELPADATLKTLITRHADVLGEVPVSDPAILADIDTPEEYERALQIWQANHRHYKP